MFDCCRQHHCCSLHQQTGWDPFPPPVVDLFLWLQTQDITLRARDILGCLNVIADRLSRPNQPIMTEWSLHPEVLNLIFRLWGTPVVDRFATSSPVYVSSSEASSTSDRCLVTGLAGEVNVHVSTVSPAQQSHSEAQDHPDGRGDTHRPLVAVTTVVSTPATIKCGSPATILSVWQSFCHNRAISQVASHTICTHGGSYAALPSSRIF